MQNLTFLKPLVAAILRDETREWTAQGFGFLRTYFGPKSNPKRFRLNLWHRRFAVPGVSTIHDHPWDFTSLIVAGNFVNIRYVMQTRTTEYTHKFAVLRTGVGGGLETAEPTSCRLTQATREDYTPGCTYSQRANEIHETDYADGAVTLNERVGDTEKARVFWSHQNNWVDAMPRPATIGEVHFATSAALQNFD